MTITKQAGARSANSPLKVVYVLLLAIVVVLMFQIMMQMDI